MATIIRNGNLFCDHCGGEYKLNLPIPVNEMTKKMKAFEELHNDCPKTWQQPQPDMTKNEHERANWWLDNGERGLSSEYIYHFFMNRDSLRFKQMIDYPYDPDDFRRCYLLLQAVPEWKKRLNELKSLSKQWSNLVDNWEKLTEMLEEQMKTGKPNGMYELMQKCIEI